MITCTLTTKHPALDYLMDKASEEEFRSAARNGNVEALRSILCSSDSRKGTDSVLLKPCPFTGKTAAHFAAENGHANVLRFLHSIGDPFTAVDHDGKAAGVFAANNECTHVFELVLLAQKSIEVADKLFPNKVSCVDVASQNKQKNIHQFRMMRDEKEDKLEKIAIEKVKQLHGKFVEEFLKQEKRPNTQSAEKIQSWITRFGHELLHYIDATYILNSAINKKVELGACAENTTVVFAYLTSVVKCKFPVNIIYQQLIENTHAFVVFDRDQDKDVNDKSGWKNVFFVDAYELENRSFFYEYIGDINQQTLDMSLSNSLELLCSNNNTTPPKELWANSEIPKIMNKTLSDLHAINVLRFSQINSK